LSAAPGRSRNQKNRIHRQTIRHGRESSGWTPWNGRGHPKVPEPGLVRRLTTWPKPRTQVGQRLRSLVSTTIKVGWPACLRSALSQEDERRGERRDEEALSARGGGKKRRARILRPRNFFAVVIPRRSVSRSRSHSCARPRSRSRPRARCQALLPGGHVRKSGRATKRPPSSGIVLVRSQVRPSDPARLRGLGLVGNQRSTPRFARDQPTAEAAKPG
jgi:hypothetical protein